MKYFAFISFQSSDAKWALWIQKQIEAYRLPIALSKQRPDLPRKIKPCFCYLSDISLKEELMMELKQQMEQSQFLIVICSPQSAKSSFVNGGIDYFVNLGRRDRIIPLIIDGVPYSNDKNECFPEALKRHFPKHSDPLQDHQILGVNINEQGAGSKRLTRKRAVVLMVARMLGLNFEDLWQREIKRQRRRQTLIGIIIAFFLTMVGLTWYLSQTVTITTCLQEQTPTNTYLPALTNAVITLTLDNEQKRDTFASISDQAIFNNIPPQMLGKSVHVNWQCPNWLPLDTSITLSKQMVIPIHRDPEVFGHIHFRLRGIQHPEQITLELGGISVMPTADGTVDCLVPLPNQRVAYPIGQDSVFMPCGPNDIIIL